MSASEDSDVEIVAHSHPKPSMYLNIPSALATPPQSPSQDGMVWPGAMPLPSLPPPQDIDMPLLTDLLARKAGELNVPPGFVLCIPCYLCKQPFNDIENFKKHLTQHAEEIHAWNAAHAQEVPLAQMQPVMPRLQAVAVPIHQPSHHPPYHIPMDFSPPPPPPMVSMPLHYHTPPFTMQPPQMQQRRPPRMHMMNDPIRMNFIARGPPILPVQPRPHVSVQPPGESQTIPIAPAQAQAQFNAQPMVTLMRTPAVSSPVEAHEWLPEQQELEPEQEQEPEQGEDELCEQIDAPTSTTALPIQSPPKRNFECDYCGKGLSSRQALKYHTTRFHREEPLVPDVIGKGVQKQYKCSVCRRRYKRHTFLLMHMKFKHGLTPTAKEAASPTTYADPDGPECPTDKLEGGHREIWSTRLYNAVASANYSPASESMDKYLSDPRQPSPENEARTGSGSLEGSGSLFVTKPKKTYPMRSPYFNPDLWLDCDSYL
ncbi:hypothetical protein KR018_004141 [Drosophila ironensis]|nr:hypothetical protein KR018_004141 [Drosophila ironensis]